ncbi:putative POM121-like protein 1 [Camelus dromedarius]|uniref:Putative POM121-like protein 1 n=1 Tax=Camelus dromedarius TaxID=9838 RepID=A0A5N4C8V7_CAMDR|nr:putative POM121-like protein 1 [Camelus dromedarius]
MVWRALGESGKGMAKQEKDPAVTEKEDQRSPDGTEGEQSEMRHLWVQRGLSSFIPRPGSLQRNLHAKSSEDIHRETPDLLYELLPPKKCHQELIQLHLRFPASAEEEGSHTHLAAPEILKEREGGKPSASLCSSSGFTTEELA